MKTNGTTRGMNFAIDVNKVIGLPLSTFDYGLRVVPVAIERVDEERGSSTGCGAWGEVTCKLIPIPSLCIDCKERLVIVLVMPGVRIKACGLQVTY